MAAASTIALVADGIDLLVAATQAAATIAPLIRQAQAEGRTTFTEAEWAQITGAEDSAEARLSQAIADAKARGQ